jgi:hypothetical protein
MAMQVRHLTRTAVAVGIVVGGLTAGAGVAAADPGPPPCGFQGCQGGPQGPGGPQQGPGGPGGPEQGPGGPGGPPRGPGGPDQGRGGPGAPGWQPGGLGGPGGPDGPGRGPGWDGPGGPGWQQGGWGGPPPPPDLAWRGIDQGRFDHQPFNYNGAWVNPIFNPDFNNWGFWFFGIWIPL